MCGIFGYKGKKRNVLLRGLKRLEYRGYDSWGYAVKEKDNVVVEKKVGKIENLDIKTSMGIAHTRWATHGKPSENNSHPHHDKNKRFYVVHNGIIENFEDLKKGMELYSDTDTEIIPNLIGKYIGEGFENAVLRAVNKMKGSFAFLVMDRKSEKLIAVRKKSPLIIGFKDKDYFISSDVQGFLPYTKDVFYLNDNEVAVVNEDINFYDFKGNRLEKKPGRLKEDFKEADKGNYKHFMLKEIHEQPEAIERTLKGQPGTIKDMKRIIITACGTSWHAGLIAEYWIEKIAGKPVEVEYASEFRYRDPVIEKGTTVIAISQSGETADTIAAVNEAKRKNARVISICNVPGSTLDRISDKTIYTKAGPEIGVASTKAFTTQLTVLFMIAKKLAGEDYKELNTIPNTIRKILKKEETLKDIMKEYYLKRNSLFLGRGVNYPIALEGALKLKEISYIHAEGYPAAEMKHGPIALIDKNMPSVFICVKDQSYDKIISNIQEVKARDGKIIAVCTEDDRRIRELADDFIEIPGTDNNLTPFISVIPLQLIAYYIADKRGCEIDKPRNLAKSVTVE